MATALAAVVLASKPGAGANFVGEFEIRSSNRCFRQAALYKPIGADVNIQVIVGIRILNLHARRDFHLFLWRAPLRG